jgi:hypothetical protein
MRAQLSRGTAEVAPRHVRLEAHAQGKRRWRNYSEALKRRVVAETLEPGASVAAVARRHSSSSLSLHLTPDAEQSPPGYVAVAADTALALWTLKESITKALGRTIWQVVGEISLNFDGTSLSWWSQPPEDSAAAWTLLAGHFRRDHRFAVALWGASPGPGYLVVQAHQLGAGKPAAGTFEVTTVASPQHVTQSQVCGCLE